MEQEKSEFLKLDAIDRDVLLWTINNSPQSLQSWINFIAVQYKKKAVHIDRDKLYQEAIEKKG